MGHSYTVHCVGIPTGLAMSKVEIAQEEHKANKQGKPISYWFSQTATGMRILGTDEHTSASTLKLPKLATCPICKGDGSNGRYFCPVCNGSGICKPGNELKWHPWQIENMKSHREEETPE